MDVAPWAYKWDWVGWYGHMDHRVGGVRYKIWGKKWNMYWTDETYDQVPREAFKEQRCCEKVPEGQVGERLGEDETTWIGKNGDDLEDGVFSIKSVESKV